MTVPIPRDASELVVRELRRLLAGRPDPVAAGVKVSTEVGYGPDGGPPSLPWLLVAEDGHTWAWPALQTATIRLTSWHHTPHSSKALAALAVALLCAPHPANAWTADPVALPVTGTDPYTSAPLATAAVAVMVRTPTQS